MVEIFLLWKKGLCKNHKIFFEMEGISMDPKREHHKILADQLIKNLAKRHMEGFYCETPEEACNLASSLMKQGSSVSWGGTMTMKEIGMDKVIANRSDLVVYDRANANSQEEIDESAEDLRLLYVGLTRARFALHLTWGHTYDSNDSALQWLLHGAEKAGRKHDTLQPDGMRERIETLARESNGAIAVRPMPSPVPAAALSHDALRTADAATPAAAR